MSEEERSVVRHLNNYCYKYTYNALDPYSYKKTYMPDSLKRLLNTPVIKNGMVCYVYELLFNNTNRIFFINSLYENIYDPHSDNGIWVDDLITTMEEERLGKEIEALHCLKHFP